jgi:hypothetical protein
MANDANARLASVLDQRIRAVVEEMLRGTFANELRNVVRGELVEALGGKVAIVRAPAAKPTGRRGGRPAAGGCNVAGCKSPHRSRGYCSAHYQAARKYGWPMPAPSGFSPPTKR